LAQASLACHQNCLCGAMPPSSPSEYRFGVGTRVLCNVQGGFRPGTIVRLRYSEPGWPPGKIVPYQVQLDEGPKIYVPVDHDRVCRKIPVAWWAAAFEGKTIQDFSHDPSGDILSRAGSKKDVNKRDFHGEVPLMHAVRFNWPKGVATLIAMKADVNVTDNFEMCPLHMAVPHGVAMMKILVNAKADLNWQDDDPNFDPQWTSKTFGDRPEHRTPLHYACLGGDAEAVSFLLKAGAELNIQDGQWKTPLHLAIEEGNTEIIDILLRHGPDVNLGNIESGMNNSPLMDASHNGDLTLVAKLINAAADANQQGKQRMSALHLAVRKNYDAIAEALLASRADMMQESQCGTALEMARKKGSADLLRVFGLNRTENTQGKVAELDAAQRKALFLD